VGDVSWPSDEARSFSLVAPGIVASAKAAETCGTSTKLHCAEPIRFHSR
jgi:hypothetical protein